MFIYCKQATKIILPKSKDDLKIPTLDAIERERRNFRDVSTSTPLELFSRLPMFVMIWSIEEIQAPQDRICLTGGRWAADENEYEDIVYSTRLRPASDEIVSTKNQEPVLNVSIQKMDSISMQLTFVSFFTIVTTVTGGEEFN